jgi:hypothetical protein
MWVREGWKYLEIGAANGGLTPDSDYDEIVKERKKTTGTATGQQQ